MQILYQWTRTPPGVGPAGTAAIVATMIVPHHLTHAAVLQKLDAGIL